MELKKLVSMMIHRTLNINYKINFKEEDNIFKKLKLNKTFQGYFNIIKKILINDIKNII